MRLRPQLNLQLTDFYEPAKPLEAAAVAMTATEEYGDIGNGGHKEL